MVPQKVSWRVFQDQILSETMETLELHVYLHVHRGSGQTCISSLKDNFEVTNFEKEYKLP